MKYNIVEILISILDVFILNNPIGITAVVVALLTGILMCIYGNVKSRIICVCSLLVLSVFSIIVCISGNSPDYLFFPIFMFPFFAITLIIFIVYDFIRMLIGIKQKNNNQ